MFKTSNYSLSNSYGKFIASQHWDIYGTTTYMNPISAPANRRIFEKLFNNEPSIQRMFFVSEPFIAKDHVHCHFLISSSNDVQTMNNLSKKFSKYGRYQIELVSSSESYLNYSDELSVCYYVTKSLYKGVDYDFLIK